MVQCNVCDMCDVCGMCDIILRAEKEVLEVDSAQLGNPTKSIYRIYL